MIVQCFYVTGMLCAHAVEPVDAKAVKGKYVESKNSNKYHKKTYRDG